MGKNFLRAALFPVLLLASCGQNTQTDAVSAATARKGPPARVLLEQDMPGAMADGFVKIAVLVNQKAGDNSRQFINGCVSEGRSMGFTVDSFVSGGDENRCREIAAGIATADYDGLIFAYGDVDFSYDILRPIAETGIPVVTFETIPYRDAQSIPGIITTFQDDYRLARLSLETLLSYTGPEGRAARVIRIGCEPGIVSLDRRAWEFDMMVKDGKIIEAASIKLDNMDNPHGDAWEALAAIISHYPPGSIDALWIPWDGFAGGCAGALASVGRQDIKIFSIGISNDDLRLMQKHSAVWLASAAVDPQLVGTVNMRLLAANLAGEKLLNIFSFAPQLIKSADLNSAVNIANLSLMLPNWGDGKGLFDDYKWMVDLKTAESKYLRIPPVTE